MEHSAYQNTVKNSGDFVAGQQVIPPSGLIYALYKAWAYITRFLLKDNEDQCGGPFLTFTGIRKKLVIVVILWLAKILLIIIFFTS